MALVIQLVDRMCNDCFKLKHLFLLSLDLVDILVKNVDELGSEHHVRTHINEPPCFNSGFREHSKWYRIFWPGMNYSLQVMPVQKNFSNCKKDSNEIIRILSHPIANPRGKVSQNVLTMAKNWSKNGRIPMSH